MASPDQPMASAPAASRPRQRLGVRDLSAGDYLAVRKDLFHLSDEAIQEYLGYASWLVLAGATVLVAVLSLAGALVAARIIRRHFVKAGLVRQPGACAGASPGRPAGCGPRGTAGGGP